MVRTLLCCLLLLLATTPAIGQVQVDVRLEKARYLVGEPIVVVVDVRNSGDEAVGYSACDGDLRLAVAGAERRVPPNIFGCFSVMGTGGSVCVVDHPPLLPPGQTTTFRYLLKEYDLKPGRYELTASGKAGVRHKETDPVPGAQFDHSLSLNIVASTENDLKVALAPLVSDADATDPVQRHHARAAIIESAPPFLHSLIARFAADYRSAVEALGRIATTSSRTHLKDLFSRSAESSRSTIVLALARIGHRDDAEFFATVLQDATVDRDSRRYAALGLGHIGGDQVVQSLERALVTAPPEMRSSIATALGNTRSRAAVPVLIGMFGNNPAQNDVCSALTTLTHRTWCGTADDPAAKRRQWLRRWNENGSNASIFGPDNCPADPVAPEIVSPAAPAVERAAPSGPPRISSLGPIVAAPNSVVAVAGYALGLEDRHSVRVLFTQGSLERAAPIGSSGRTVSGGPDGGVQYMDVVVPAELTPGRWQLVVDAHGRRSAPVAVEITEVPQVELVGISPPRPHPAQGVLLATKRPARVSDLVQLTDARGTQWRIATGVSSIGISLTLPDDVADGEASIRVGRTQNGVDRFSAPLRFHVTSGALPLKPLAVALMRPVAPGQWTDLVKDREIEFELRRADRIDVEFRQGDVALISRATGPDTVHVRVPGRLAPGSASVRNRTWIEQSVSDWSAPTSFRVLERPVAPSITAIEAGPVRNLVWWSGDAGPAFVQTRPGGALVLRGHFPVARAADLRVQLRGTRETLDLSATDVDGGVRIEIPARAVPGDWRLVVGTRDGRTSPQEVTAVRVK